MKDRVLSAIEELRDEMVEALSRICRIPAVSPHNGGTGEEEKAREIERLVTLSETSIGSKRRKRTVCPFVTVCWVCTQAEMVFFSVSGT